MSSYYGDFAAGSTVRVRFNSINPSTGAPGTLLSGALTITKDGADLVSPAGVTLTPDVGAVTGRNEVVIVTATDPTNFAAGHDYAVRLSAGTVGGVSAAGIYLAEFSIANRSARLDLTQSITSRNQDSVTAPTVADALQGAWGEAFAREGVVGTSYAKRLPDNSGPARTFVLDSGTDPTSRS